MEDGGIGNNFERPPTTFSLGPYKLSFAQRFWRKRIKYEGTR
jgi:hypothetical protein